MWKEELGEENVAYQVDFKQTLGADVNVKNTTHHLKQCLESNTFFKCMLYFFITGTKHPFKSLENVDYVGQWSHVLFCLKRVHFLVNLMCAQLQSTNAEEGMI